MLLARVRNNLFENIELLQQLTNDEFTQQNVALSNASIGAHMRHIIELFGCLVESYTSGVINYEDRKRAALLETDKNEAMKILKKYSELIDKPDKALHLQNNLISPTEKIRTSYYRELLYNLEHSIHHQALIKVALLNLPHIKIASGFGIAPATIEYRNQCAQ